MEQSISFHDDSKNRKAQMLSLNYELLRLEEAKAPLGPACSQHSRQEGPGHTCFARMKASSKTTRLTSLNRVQPRGRLMAQLCRPHPQACFQLEFLGLASPLCAQSKLTLGPLAQVPSPMHCQHPEVHAGLQQLLALTQSGCSAVAQAGSAPWLGLLVAFPVHLMGRLH